MQRFALLAVVLLVAVPLSGCLQGLLPQRATQPEDYLSDQRYTTWIVEVDWVAGQRPSSAAIGMLQDRLDEVARKDRIDIRVSSTSLGEGRSQWTLQQIRDLSERSRDHNTGGSTVTSHVLYLDGRFSDGDALGIAIGNDLAVVFKDAIGRACSPPLCLFSETRIEQAVLVHEMGHLMGLVNRGIPMSFDREDPDHPHHSTNDESVMYYAVRTAGAILGLGTIPTTFDAHDKQDLCNAGGRCPPASGDGGPLPTLPTLPVPTPSLPP